MVALNGFICGLNANEIGRLEPNSFMSVLQLLQYNAAVFPSGYHCVFVVSIIID